MAYFIIGDIHGCYYTMRQMIDSYWRSGTEKLVLLGDLVNKGKHTFAVLEYVMKLQKEFPEKVFVLKGNNEYLFEKFYRDGITLSAKQKFENYNLDYLQVLDWMENLPHFYENGKVFFSHAGIPVDSEIPPDHENLDLIFNKKSLKNINKTQFLGHLVVDQPTFDEEENAWYLDTGAGYGKKLSAVRADDSGNVTDIIQLNVNRKDIPQYN